MATQPRLTPAFDDEAAWQAVLARDKAADGRFVTGVLTTGIYCRPSCAARHPRRENVRFFATCAEASRAGLRPCLRCRPDEVTREARAIERALRMIDEAETPPSLAALAARAGYSPHHFHRMFKRATGVTPAATRAESEQGS
jgi:AraC family transcriptional regulator, regulatory protein of adaptative response / methylated-DNA-[protein]-cysteine methyltransferase